jgi:hypothetical protein
LLARVLENKEEYLTTLDPPPMIFLQAKWTQDPVPINDLKYFMKGDGWSIFPIAKVG